MKLGPVGENGAISGKMRGIGAGLAQRVVSWPRFEGDELEKDGDGSLNEADAGNLEVERYSRIFVPDKGDLTSSALEYTLNAFEMLWVVDTEAEAAGGE